MRRLIVLDKKTRKPRPCVMCGRNYPTPDAVHAIDEKEWKKAIGHDSVVNGIAMCPNCHRVFDENLRPHLYRALSKFGCRDLPKGWAKSNKKREAN